MAQYTSANSAVTGQDGKRAAIGEPFELSDAQAKQLRRSGVILIKGKVEEGTPEARVIERQAAHFDASTATAPPLDLAEEEEAEGDSAAKSKRAAKPKPSES